jgi:hypothetical protein
LGRLAGGIAIENLQLSVSSARTVPVEAEALDADGVPIHALLHLNGLGNPVELEIYKDDSSPLSTPSADVNWNLCAEV